MGTEDAFSASTLAAVVAASEDAIFVKDTALRYVSINAAGARMVGRAAAEVIGSTDADLFAAPTAKKMIDRDQAIMKSSSVHTYEDTGVLDGRVRWYRSKKGPACGSDGTVLGLWGISRDITDERGNQFEREQLLVELRARLDELTTVESKLAQAERLATLGRLAAVLAHEIRNPLAVILNAASIARRNVVPTAEQSVFDIIEEEVARLNSLVADLLDFARPKSAVFSERPVGPLVKDVLDRVLALSSAKTIDAQLVGLDVPVSVAVDERLLVRALVNVLENACESIDTKGSLTVAITTGNGMASIRVSDTGRGLSEPARENLFQPFFTTKATGTGLGLYVVKRIVDDHGGHVVIVSDEHGTTVTLALPIAQAP